MVMRDKLLVVDDCEIDRAIIKEIFKNKFTVLESVDGAEALVVLSKHRDDIAVILMDIYMPEMTGIETFQRMKKARLVDEIPVVLMTAEALTDNVLNGIEFGMADFIAKPFNSPVVYRRILNVIGEQEEVAYMPLFDVNNPYSEMQPTTETVMGMPAEVPAVMPLQYTSVPSSTFDMEAVGEFEMHLQSMAKNAFRSRGFENTLHLRRIQLYTKAILQAISEDDSNGFTFPEELIEIIARASIYHDIGKLALPDEVVVDKGVSWVNQKKLYESHTIRGSELLRLNNNPKLESFIKLISNIALYHHERWDGTGYPYGLKGMEIPMAAQIVGLVQQYDSLLLRNRHKKQGAFDSVVHTIFMDFGAYNPLLTAILPRCKERFQQIAESNGIKVK